MRNEPCAGLGWGLGVSCQQVEKAPALRAALCLRVALAVPSALLSPWPSSRRALCVGSMPTTPSQQPPGLVGDGHRHGSLPGGTQFPQCRRELPEEAVRHLPGRAQAAREVSAVPGEAPTLSLWATGSR